MLPDSTFCEVCGHKLGTPPARSAAAEGGQAAPGSLRSELAFLAGSLDQAKTRLDQWKQKGEQSKRAAERKQEQRQTEVEEARQERKKRNPVRAVLQFLTGLAALAAFVYLVIRLPRNTPFSVVMRLWTEWQSEFGLDELA